VSIITAIKSKVLYKQSSAAASPPRAPCRMQREPGPSYMHHQQKRCGMHGEMPVRFHFCRNRAAEQVRAERAVSGQAKDPAGAVAETKVPQERHFVVPSEVH